jgi:hypothetical protein
MVVVIKKERNQLHDAVETAAGLNTTRQCAKKMLRYPLNQL